MNALARRLAPLAGAALLGLGLAAPAQAQVYSRTDATGDVTVSTCTNTKLTTCNDALAAPGNHPDIVRSVSTHTASIVRVKARFADLTTYGDRMYQLRVVTGAGRHVRLWVETYGGKVVYKGLHRDSDDTKVTCSGLGYAADYTAKTVALTIPQSCLGNPSYVRVGFGAALFSSATKFRADDALLSGMESSQADLKLGPSLARY